MKKPDPIRTPDQIMQVMPIMHPRSEEEARRFGEVLGEQTDVLLQKLKASGVPPNVLTVLRVEHKGGPCPRCGRPWVRKTLKNRFAELVWYEPECSCYYRCPACHRSLHELEEAGKLTRDRCPYCRYRMFEWIQGLDGKPRRVARLAGVDDGSRTREGRADARR